MRAPLHAGHTERFQKSWPVGPDAAIFYLNMRVFTGYRGIMGQCYPGAKSLLVICTAVNYGVKVALAQMRGTGSWQSFGPSALQQVDSLHG